MRIKNIQYIVFVLLTSNNICVIVETFHVSDTKIQKIKGMVV